MNADPTFRLRQLALGGLQIRNWSGRSGWWGGDRCSHKWRARDLKTTKIKLKYTTSSLIRLVSTCSQTLLLSLLASTSTHKHKRWLLAQSGIKRRLHQDDVLLTTKMCDHTVPNTRGDKKDYKFSEDATSIIVHIAWIIAALPRWLWECRIEAIIMHAKAPCKHLLIKLN